MVDLASHLSPNQVLKIKIRSLSGAMWTPIAGPVVSAGYRPRGYSLPLAEGRRMSRAEIQKRAAETLRRWLKGRHTFYLKATGEYVADLRSTLLQFAP